jgi:uncharacterized circularly permuted ATP-grasp superfamily protein
MAQPTLSLSTAPTLIDDDIWSRATSTCARSSCNPQAVRTTGGLTRVALTGSGGDARTPGSLVVNSSQGGGSKDT